MFLVYETAFVVSVVAQCGLLPEYATVLSDQTLSIATYCTQQMLQYGIRSHFLGN
jgi:hypothetical protein